MEPSRRNNQELSAVLFNFYILSLAELWVAEVIHIKTVHLTVIIQVELSCVILCIILVMMSQ